MGPSTDACSLGFSRYGAAVLALSCFFAGLSYADRLPPDGVEEVRRALESGADKATLDSRIAALRTLGEMRRALALTWPEMSKSRELLADCFLKAARAAIREGDQAARLAAITLIGELDRGLAGPDPSVTLAQSLVPDLADLVRRAEPGVSEVAARSLGKIAADTKTALSALGELITAPAVSQRLAAASALNEMMQVLIQAANVATRVGTADLYRVGQPVVGAAARGLSDSEPAVRRRSMEAIYTASSVLTRYVGRGVTGTPIPLDTFIGERREMAPLIQALAEQAPALARALSDRDPEVRRLAARTLENMGYARELLQRSAPAPGPVKEGRIGIERGPEGPAIGGTEGGELQLLAQRLVAQAAGEDLLLPGLRNALPALIDAVADPDERVRLAAIDVLETLGPQAAAAIPALTQAMEDRSRFVRWAAARTLGKIGPVDGISMAIPGLIKLLEYLDGDVRTAAATALERLGPMARDAVPALAENLSSGASSTVQVAALRALVAIGTDAASALPAIVRKLADTDARVRQAAAEALGRFGPAARGTVDALTRALDDSDAEVRKAASEALLSILPGTGK